MRSPRSGAGAPAPALRPLPRQPGRGPCCGGGRRALVLHFQQLQTPRGRGPPGAMFPRRRERAALLRVGAPTRPLRPSEPGRRVLRALPRGPGSRPQLCHPPCPAPRTLLGGLALLLLTPGGAAPRAAHTSPRGGRPRGTGASGWPHTLPGRPAVPRGRLSARLSGAPGAPLAAFLGAGAPLTGPQSCVPPTPRPSDPFLNRPTFLQMYLETRPLLPPVSLGFVPVPPPRPRRPPPPPLSGHLLSDPLPAGRCRCHRASLSFKATLSRPGAQSRPRPADRTTSQEAPREKSVMKGFFLRDWFFFFF